MITIEPRKSDKNFRGSFLAQKLGSLYFSQPVNAYIIKFFRIQAAALIKPQIFLGNIRIKDQHIIRADSYINTVPVKLCYRMSFQLRYSAKKIITGRSNVQPDVIIRKESDHRRIFCSCYAMLNLIKLQAFYGKAYILCSSPLTDMCL